MQQSLTPVGVASGPTRFPERQQRSHQLVVSHRLDRLEALARCAGSSAVRLSSAVEIAPPPRRSAAARIAVTACRWESVDGGLGASSAGRPPLRRSSRSRRLSSAREAETSAGRGPRRPAGAPAHGASPPPASMTSPPPPTVARSSSTPSMGSRSAIVRAAWAHADAAGSIERGPGRVDGLRAPGCRQRPMRGGQASACGDLVKRTSTASASASPPTPPDAGRRARRARVLEQDRGCLRPERARPDRTARLWLEDGPRGGRRAPRGAASRTSRTVSLSRSGISSDAENAWARASAGARSLAPQIIVHAADQRRRRVGCLEPPSNSAATRRTPTSGRPSPPRPRWWRPIGAGGEGLVRAGRAAEHVGPTLAERDDELLGVGPPHAPHRRACRPRRRPGRSRTGSSVTGSLADHRHDPGEHRAHLRRPAVEEGSHPIAPVARNGVGHRLPGAGGTTLGQTTWANRKTRRIANVEATVDTPKAAR